MSEKRTFKTVAARAALIAVATCVASSGVCLAQRAQAPSSPGSTQNVNVVNQPTVTVGSMPAVSLSGTPTVSVTGTPAVSISGTPAVSLSGTPAVSLSGTPTVNATSVDALQAVQHTASLNAASGVSIATEGISPNAGTPYVVPAGKRLVIDTISNDTQVDGGGETVVVCIDIGYGSGSSLAGIRLWAPTTVTGGTSSSVHSFGTAHLQAYADQGASVTCFLNRFGQLSTGAIYAHCQWSGHLVDLPTVQ